jgi:5'-3' exonuclease
MPKPDQGALPMPSRQRNIGLVKIHLVDGTYELFRAFFGAPATAAPDGREIGATRAFARSMLLIVSKEGATHVAIAFDKVIESFRNELFDGYKTGEGIDPALGLQFELAERMSRALGFVTWPMIEFEADDALATAAHRFKDEDGVEQILICSPDKDLCQCVIGQKVITVDRRRKTELDADGVLEKFGVAPESIPDWLALVGDAADGIPGIPRWGAKGAAAVLSAYPHIEQIPAQASDWAMTVRGAATLATNLQSQREDAMLYKTLATLRTDVPLQEALPDLRWRGANRQALTALCQEIGDNRLLERVPYFDE